MKFTTSKDMDQYIRRLIQDGWQWIPGRKHNRLIPPNGHGFIIVSNSPSDHRALQNLRRHVRHSAVFSMQSKSGRVTLEPNLHRSDS